MAIIRLLDARRGLYRKCEELFGDAKIAEAIYRFLCDGIEDCEDVAHERKRGKWEQGCCSECGYDWGKDAPIASVPNFCPDCGVEMRGEQDGS